MPLRDWDQTYREQTAPPWDTGFPSAQLRQLVESGTVRPCRVLDLGCGTGTNAIYLAQKGFDATGVDISPVAVEKAQAKAQAAGVKTDFVCSSVLELPDLGDLFGFVFDCGCFHVLEKTQRGAFVDQVVRVMRLGGVMFLLCGNSKEPLNPGPPTVSEEELRATFSRDFAIEWIREFRFDTTALSVQPLGYAMLARRK